MWREYPTSGSEDAAEDRGTVVVVVVVVLRPTGTCCAIRFPEEKEPLKESVAGTGNFLTPPGLADVIDWM